MSFPSAPYYIKWIEKISGNKKPAHRTASLLKVFLVQKLANWSSLLKKPTSVLIK